MGEQFLQDLGFPQEVTQFVRGHVQAKRYLVFINKDYHDQLSEASKGTSKTVPYTREEKKIFI